MTAIELGMADVERNPAAVSGWLLAHGLNPRDTAPGVIVRDGKITAQLYRRNAGGEFVRARDHDGHLGVAADTVTVPLIVPVPQGLGRVIP